MCRLEIPMSLELGLSHENLEVLRQEVEDDHDCQDLRDKMRAAVLLCTQELINSAKKSSFEQFHRELPQVANIEPALGLAVKWLKQRGLLHTLSVLHDEVDPDELKEAVNAATGSIEDFV